MLKQQNVIQLHTHNNGITEQLKQDLKHGNIRSYVVIGRYRIMFDSNLKFTKIVWKQSRSSNKYKHFHPNSTIINDLIRRMHTQEYGLKSNYIECFTRLHTMLYNTGTKEMYRAYSYFYKRPWNDWCESRWESGTQSDCYPCRLLMFVDTSKMEFENFENIQHPYLALVRASENDERTRITRKNKDCMLIDSFQADNYIRIINCGTITKPIFVMPDVSDVKIEENKTIFQSNHRIKIKDRTTWSNLFINLSWI